MLPSKGELRGPRPFVTGRAALVTDECFQGSAQEWGLDSGELPLSCGCCTNNVLAPSLKSPLSRNLGLTEQLQRLYEEFLGTLHPDSLNVLQLLCPSSARA